MRALSFFTVKTSGLKLKSPAFCSATGSVFTVNFWAQELKFPRLRKAWVPYCTTAVRTIYSIMIIWMEVGAKSTKFSQLSVDRRVCYRCLTGTLWIQFDRNSVDAISVWRMSTPGRHLVDTRSTPARHPPGKEKRSLSTVWNFDRMFYRNPS